MEGTCVCKLFCVIALKKCITSLIPGGKFGSPYLRQLSAAARSALPIPNCACSIVLCSNKGTAASAWDL